MISCASCVKSKKKLLVALTTEKSHYFCPPLRQSMKLATFSIWIVLKIHLKDLHIIMDQSFHLKCFTDINDCLLISLLVNIFALCLTEELSRSVISFGPGWGEWWSRWSIMDSFEPLVNLENAESMASNSGRSQKIDQREEFKYLMYASMHHGF